MMCVESPRPFSVGDIAVAITKSFDFEVGDRFELIDGAALPDTVTFINKHGTRTNWPAGNFAHQDEFAAIALTARVAEWLWQTYSDENFLGFDYRPGNRIWTNPAEHLLRLVETPRLVAALLKFVDFEARYDREDAVAEDEVQAATAEARAILVKLGSL